MNEHLKLPELKFDQPEFHGGINVTVRYGDKWLHAVDIGDTVQLGGTAHTARIVGKLYMNFHQIPAAVHKLNHDKNCRTVRGITEEITRIYGPFPNGIIGACTVLFFAPNFSE